MINVATDWRIIEKGKQYAIIDRCVLQKATPQEISQLNQKYAFVVPIVLLMESAMANHHKVIDNIQRIEDFLIITTCNAQIQLKDLIPCQPYEIMKKDLGVSLLRQPKDDAHLVYFRPYDVNERIDLLTWAKNGAAQNYYRYFNNIEQRFKQSKHILKLGNIVDRTIDYGFMHGQRYIPKDQIEVGVAKWIKQFKQTHGYNPFYGNSLKDVLGLVKSTLLKISIIDIFRDLAVAYQLNMSWPLKQIALRPNYPHPDDYAKYTYYFYFINMCMTYCGFTMEKSHTRDWEYLFYLPFCPIISGDKRFFKNLKLAMKDIGTDWNVGITISDRIQIWGEDNI